MICEQLSLVNSKEWLKIESKRKSGHYLLLHHGIVIALKRLFIICTGYITGHRVWHRVETLVDCEDLQPV